VTHSYRSPEGPAPVSAAGKISNSPLIYLRSAAEVLIPPRFSEIEAVTFLANLILKYKFVGTPTEKMETSVEMKERLLRWNQGSLTLHPVKVPLTFTIRDD
jgi:hypothetical protein